MVRVVMLKREILLPSILNTKLDTLAGLKQETVGALLYSPVTEGDHLECAVDFLYMLNVGTSRRFVAIDPRQKAVLDRFLYLRPAYRHIEFHCQVSGNPELSEADLVHYRSEIRRNHEFIAMIVTKDVRKIIAYGEGQRNTSIRKVETPSNFFENERRISNEFRRYEREPDHRNVPRWHATRARKR